MSIDQAINEKFKVACENLQAGIEKFIAAAENTWAALTDYYELGEITADKNTIIELSEKLDMAHIDHECDFSKKTDTLETIAVSTSGPSDAKVRENLTAILQEMGLENDFVWVSNNEDTSPSLNI